MLNISLVLSNWILLLPIEYDIEIQRRLPAALCVNQNFTKDHEPNIAELVNNGAYIDFGFHGGGGQFGAGADSKEAVAMRDNIAEHVW